MRPILCLAALLLAAPAHAITFGEGVIRAVPKRASLHAPGGAEAVQVDVRGLAAMTPGQAVLLPGGGDAATAARVREVRQRPDGTLEWTARVNTAAGPQTAVIVIREGHAFGWLPQPEGPALRLETRKGQSWLGVERQGPRPEGPDVRLLPEPDAASRALRKRQDAVPSAGTPRIDVVVAYQPSLVELWGSVAAVQARIAYLETLTNQAYVDSGMDLTIRVVGTHLLEVPERLDNSDALDLITFASADPVKQEIDRVRALYGADLVKLMRNFDRPNQTSCGIAWLGGYHGNAFVPAYAFSVSADRGFGTDACGEWTFSHELGHNQGAHHDTETTGGDYGAFVYSRGHRQTLDPNSGFATVMAYDVGPQDRIGQFSNPRQLLCLGQPCGIEGEADNARGVAETAALVAGMVAEPASSALPELTIEDVVVTEGQTGRRPATFVLRLSQPATTAIGVSFATRAASATNTDFVPRSGSLQIQPGQTAISLSVDVRGDTLVEPDEYFALDLLGATGARIVRHQGVATIASDDPLPLLSIANIRVGEGNTGVRDAVFTATLSAASNMPVRFDVASGEFGGEARSGDDFQPLANTTLEIPAGALGVQFALAIAGDQQPEPDEQFYVTLGGIQGARVDDSIILATIVDDDAGGAPALPTLQVQPLEVAEGNAGFTDAGVTVTLDAPAAQAVEFALAAEGITATAGLDFDASGLAQGLIPAGQSSVQLALRINGDLVDEADEVLLLRPANVVGAIPAAEPARITIRDDDGSAGTPPLVARDDRVLLRENAGAMRLDVLANDAVAPAALAGAHLLLSEQPVYGTVQLDTGGTPGTAADDAVVYTPAANRWYEDAFGYRLCESGGRCTDGVVQVVVRPSPGEQVDSASGAGFLDFEMPGVRAIPSLSVRAADLAYSEAQVVSLAPDSTPESPWDREGTHEVHGVAVASWMPGSPNEPYRDFRQLASASALQGGDVDLYLGLDDNGNGRADPGETRCVAAMGGPVEQCELDFRNEMDVPQGYWALLHNRIGQATQARLELTLLRRDIQSAFVDEFAASGPANHPGGGEPLPARVSWVLPDLLPGSSAYVLVAIEDRDAGQTAYVPVRIDRTEGALFPAQVLHEDWAGAIRSVPAGAADEALFVDVPEGATSLEVTVSANPALDLYLSRIAPGGADPRIAPAPPRAQAVRVFPAINGAARIEAPELAPGRWYLTLVNPAAQDATALLEVRLDAQAPPLARGSYFNPERSGHGLFLYPAGADLAGLWYTYLQDGTPTWYYLQGFEPGSGGRWLAPIYRSTWNGSGNDLVRIGQATATVLADGLLFTYRLDGETGSEKLVPLGSGCPTLAGLPVDASSHWFDPSRAGTGYSVQLFPDYEFYAAFVYDARGVARFLTSEAGGFRGGDATLPLEQLTGFCPLCVRSGAPARADIGTLRRRFVGGTLVGMELDAVYGGGVPGAWSASDSVQPLGGAGTTQGCPTP